MYHYKIIKIKSIYDGDTLIALIDLGFGVYKTEKLRLAFIDTPEIRGEERPAGLKARDYLRNLLFGAMEDGKEITIRTSKDRKGKYGRYIAEIFIEGYSVNEKLLEEGYAEPYK
jgi:micrococcal nuclease